MMAAERKDCAFSHGSAQQTRAFQVPASEIQSAIESVPAGGYAVGVSGGADSVALLSLLRDRVDLQLVVAHLDHETRGKESAADARFVQSLCAQWNLDCALAGRGELEKCMPHLPKNTSARFRAVRFELFRRVVHARGLQGVILAHHADDKAETVLQRLVRNAGYAGLAGMSARARIGGLVVLRPMLSVRRNALRAVLRERDQPWREDASNASAKYLRNRLRAILSVHPDLTAALLELSGACRALRDWSRRTAPSLESNFTVGSLADLPPILARESARRWLNRIGVPPDQIDPATIERLMRMSDDAATPSRQHFPGKIEVRRRSGRVSGPRA
jgi:tRNA(Ile)-lysidine synthase